jgi:hypothetical protein
LAWLRKNRGGKKEYAFVFKPNDTYSAFEEEAPLPPPGVDAGTETQAPEENEDLPEDEDSLPF